MMSAPRKQQRFDVLDDMANVSRKIRTLFDARVREKGLTLARARTLLRVQRGEAANQKELAVELEIETATLVRLIDGLDREELDAVLQRLARRWAADDRIAVLVDSLSVKLRR